MRESDYDLILTLFFIYFIYLPLNDIGPLSYDFIKEYFNYPINEEKIETFDYPLFFPLRKPYDDPRLNGPCINPQHVLSLESKKKLTIACGIAVTVGIIYP